MFGRTNLVGLGDKAHDLGKRVYTQTSRAVAGVGVVLKSVEVKEDNDGASADAPPVYRPLSQLHDLRWSRKLWAEAAWTTFVVFASLFALFAVLGVCLLGLVDGRGLIDSIYLASATVTMVKDGRNH